MHRNLFRHVLPLVGLAALAACGSPVKPSSLVGNWSGVWQTHSGEMSMRFSLDNGQVVAVVCGWNQLSRGVAFLDVPVTVRSRAVQFVIPSSGEEYFGVIGPGPHPSIELKSSKGTHVTLSQSGSYCGQE